MDNLSFFVERLEELIFYNKLNAKELSIALGLGPSCITHYLRRYCGPTVESLIKIADFFHCSTDFLLGREEENDLLKFKPCPPFSQQLEFLKKKYNCSSYAIYRNNDISKTCYYDWKRGKRQPSLDNVIRLADHFGCRVDFILGREV